MFFPDTYNLCTKITMDLTITFLYCFFGGYLKWLRIIELSATGENLTVF